MVILIRSGLLLQFIQRRIAYTDDSSTPQTVNVEGALAFDPYHLVNGTTDPRTGNK